MSQCVPSWEVEEDNPTPSRLTLRSNSNSTVPAVSILDYEVAELTWENGQLAMHGLGLPRAAMSGKLAPTTTATSTPPNHPKSAAWGGDKPRACGTLESIVNQASHLAGSGAKVATQLPFGVEAGPGVNELVTWLDHNQRVAAAATMAMDALVPCSNNPTTLPDDRAKAARNNTRAVEFPPVVAGMGGSARVGSCGGPVAVLENGRRGGKVAARPEWSGRDQSACGSASTLGRDSQRVTLDTYERDTGLGFTSTTSFGSHDDYTSSGKPGTRTAATCTADENDSACHSRPQREGGDEEKKKNNGKSSVSTKRSRAAAIHNQSERKRRDKINQRMKTLQKLVPSSSKTDKASMLDEVIEYLKQLQAQVQMVNRMNMQPAMMLPMAMQQQLQMSMMTPMNLGMGMGMGMGMLDMNSMTRPTLPPLLHPTPFMPSWDGGLSAAAAATADRLQSTPSTITTDPLTAFLACQSQQQPAMNMDAYSRMAALYQQLHQKPPGSAGSKN